MVEKKRKRESIEAWILNHKDLAMKPTPINALPL